MNDKLTIC